MIAGLEGHVNLLSGLNRALVSILAGGISAFSMAPFDIFAVLFLTIPVFVWLIDNASHEPAPRLRDKIWQGFKPGFFFGFGYFVSGLWWIGNALLVDASNFAWALPLAVLALPAFLAIFWGIATAFALMFWSNGVARVFILSACLALAEYVRGFVFTGFPWNTLGYAAYTNPLSMQSASIFGVYAMTVFVVLVSSLVIFLLPTDGKRTPIHMGLVFVCLILAGAHLGYGYWRLGQVQNANVEGVSLRLVQPAIDQKDKFDRTKEQALFKRYLDLSTSQHEGQSLSDITHLIWPESAFPFLLTERRDALAALAAMLPEGTNLITGAARAEPGAAGQDENLVFNSVLVLNDEGIITSAADKVHLVPFGEYLPFQKVAEQLGLEQLTKVQGGFSPGASRKLLKTDSGPSFLPLVCYEIIFSGDVRGNTENAGFILNLTNDAWFGISSGPYQHLRQAVVRSVEEGLPLVRVANSGISGVFDAYGRSRGELPLGKQGVLDTVLPAALKQTVFAKHGNNLFWILIALFLTIGLVPRFLKSH